MLDFIGAGLWYWLLAFTPGVVAGMAIMHWTQGCAIAGSQAPVQFTAQLDVGTGNVEEIPQ